MNILGAMKISAAGMKVQGDRIRVVAQNLANADTAANTPNAEPYRRKTILFKNVMDKTSGVELVQTDRVVEDKDSEFRLKYAPDHPGADKNGYVRTPDIDTLVEIMDMREAQRTYEANLGMIQISKTILGQTVDLLRT